jgi:signal transduction histidine kinase
MINDLLEVTRAQAGKLTIEPQCTSVADAIAYAVDTLQGAATAKGITLSSDIACDCHHVR